MRELKMRRKWLWLAPVALLGFALFLALGGAVVRLLWNWLMPELFGWREITLWQALGLLALCRILFGGLGGGHPRSRFRRRMGGHLERLTPEERERFRERLRERWCAEPRSRESEGP
jgi:hypothetical protein